MKTGDSHLIPLLISLVFVATPSAGAEPPRTVAESSDYKETSRHAEVVKFCEQLANASPLVRLGQLGTSHDGRKLPLIILADPPISTPDEAAKSGKLVVLAIGNIHAGEVDGKEALLMLARDLALAPERPLLKDLVLVFAPIFNADGNDKMGKNRPAQAGPTLVGTRVNAQDFDLNRDFIKLESPEVRALVRQLNKWDPAVFIDCHTTNGSYHRYTLTYEGGRCPAGDSRVFKEVRDEMLPDVGRRLEKKTGFKSYFYGNFSADRSRWETVPPTARYSTHYVSLHNRIGILSESYSYASYKDRVLASKAFVQSICEYTAENKDKLAKLLSEARQATVKAGQNPQEKDTIVLRHKPAPLGRPFNFLGFVEEKKGDHRVPTDRPKEYELVYYGDAEPTLSVRRPNAYLFPATLGHVAENLQRHGIAVEELREDIELDLEVYRIDKITRAELFQKHRQVTLDATPHKETRRVEAGSILVRTAQPLGSLAAYLLEPQSPDGLATWNFFDAVLAEGKDFPVVRLLAPVALTSGKIRPLPEDRGMNKPVTFDTLYGAGGPPNYSGSPVGGIGWLDDGEHFLQMKEGRLRKVHALTGRSQLCIDVDKLANGLAALPTIGKQAAQTRARSPFLRMNPQRTAVLIEHQGDFDTCNVDGTEAVRLTKSPGTKELATFSPDGKQVAFVRNNNLFVVDVATQTERALTTEGTAVIFNGKADWVYFEEVFNRNHQAYWWSPDSSCIAFLRTDDSPVLKFPLIDAVNVQPNPETTPYPKAGDANPTVRLGILPVAEGEATWVDLKAYPEADRLLVRVGWMPDSKNVYFYAQNRTQTWLDVCAAPREGGKTTVLFRETTKAWVDDPGAPTFLKDGSFLLASERTGWKHLYHFTAAGKLECALTSGDWEARTLHVVDEAGGWVYFSGTRDSHLGTNLYRVKLDGTGLERLTKTSGDHRVSVSPKGNLFIDTHSDHRTPAHVALCRTDGAIARMLDTNPVYVLEEYRRGAYELLKIPTPDGFILEASILKPPNFDPTRRYPVWFTTYAGPAAPVVHDSWGNGRLRDEMLCQMGYLVFRCDPRSASGKGAVSAWTAYRQLGVQELKDIETAIGWLTSHSYVDAARIGMTGHSYGGFMTAFALTHSKLFAAGVAGAPVTDWRNYDSVYTERYMGTPKENPDGYNKTSVVQAARNLHGKLLIAHGLMDDNVHPQNSLQLVDALQRADKDFEMLFYPRNRHGFGGRQYERKVLEFMGLVLRPEP
jgi:dipeptidyl aminopeptidase/acylaminoacyl peptidase